VSLVEELARPEILALAAYDHAAWLPQHERLHANELPWRNRGDATRAGLNRYPEPQPRELVARLAALYAVAAENVLVTRGSDEAIDLLMRTFCRAGEDAVLLCPPTFGMYALAAGIQGARVVSVPLVQAQGFALDEAALLARCTENVKLVFVCSPNNPTGNLMSAAALLRIAAALDGRALLIVDEAYIEFADVPSLTQQPHALPQLVVLRTLSKAHALAGARCGAVIAATELVALLAKVISPYAIAQPTVECVLPLLEGARLAEMRERIAIIKAERARVAQSLRGRSQIDRVWHSDANFLLVDFIDAAAAARALALASAARLLIRDVRRQPGLGCALRISIGTAEQNDRLLEALR
jgi:histidinol-phosphate aminotransferase